MAHTITLHLPDASGRVERFMRKRAALAERPLPKKELGPYLNLSPDAPPGSSAGERSRFFIAPPA